MGQLNDTTKKGGFKHLTEEERYKIETMLKAGCSSTAIAGKIGKSARTVQREIKRGTVGLMNSDLTMRREYCADYAQLKHEEAGKGKGPRRKISGDQELMSYIEGKILGEGWSPDAVAGRSDLEGGWPGGARVCTKTIYNAIDAGAFPNLTNKALPEKRRRGKQGHKYVRPARNNLKGASISERPPEAEGREEYGHWEMDCVLPGKGKGLAALLTLTERMTREEIIVKLARKTQERVCMALDGLEKALGAKAFREKFKTITLDNGAEFLDFIALEKSARKNGKQRTTVYYAHPYSSWERGSNERMNRMVRRFFPKGCHIGRLPAKKIKDAENWLNNYPRRILGYMTPAEAAAEAMAS